MVEAIKILNIGLRFILELCLVAALGYSGYHLTQNTFARWSLLIVLPATAIVLWSLFIAPRAAHLLALPQRLVVEIVLFGAAALLLSVAGQKTAALTFAAAVLINEVLLLVWRN